MTAPIQPDRDQVIRDCCNKYGISESELLGVVKTRKFVLARWEAWLEFSRRGMADCDVARMFGVNRAAVFNARYSYARSLELFKNQKPEKELKGTHHTPGQRYCDCGRVALKKSAAGYVCARCARIESDMRSHEREFYGDGKVYQEGVE